ncbi:MAG: hypothetical protein BRD48_04545 [Bacteroidetes bacterium QS_9_68_14]|nr:MAG: hypothetical protein BRD48_04545 [Bacteroidetes bacterium QS_9_68_14]
MKGLPLCSTFCATACAAFHQAGVLEGYVAEAFPEVNFSIVTGGPAGATNAAYVAPPPRRAGRRGAAPRQSNPHDLQN